MRRSLTDNDTYFGPFTFGRWTKCFSVMLDSGDEEDGPQRCTFRIIAFGWVVRIDLPNIIQPYRIRHEANWDAATVARLGRNYYFETYEREYGFSLSDMGGGYDFLQIHYGRQTHSGNDTQSWCCHLPWKQWKAVRFSLYDTDGAHFWTEAQDGPKRGLDKFKDRWAMEAECPKAHFLMRDFDGEEITATAHIEEQEWHRGTGWFTWLKYFYAPKISRSLDLEFSAEVGPEKGSWKGGTTGHSIDMLDGETVEDAFRRYCANGYKARRRGMICPLTYLGWTSAPAPKPKHVPTIDEQECDAEACKK